MRTGKELILASKAFTKENRLRSWVETITTASALLVLIVCLLMGLPIWVKAILSVLTALFVVRLFIIYHDYQHHTILQHSVVAQWLMQLFGILLLAPQTIWKRSHDHHHHHNSKLTLSGIGSYPTISTERFFSLTKAEQRLYLINRHPLTIIGGHLTLFIYWLNLKSFIQSPKRHLDSLVALCIHALSGVLVWYFLGATTFLFAWFMPFFVAFGIGSYLFYCQHNFPKAQYSENHDWKYENAAMESTSFLKMNAIGHWFTANIGYHHVHHLNSRIPFYRLPEAMKNMPELQNPLTTSWNVMEVIRCFRLKFWDVKDKKMVSLKQAKQNHVKLSMADKKAVYNVA